MSKTHNEMLREFEKDIVEVNQPLEETKSFNTNKYHRQISDKDGNTITVDVYDVLKAFEVTCPALQHLTKKALCVGIRGHKDKSEDLIDIKDSAVRAMELNK